MMTGSMVVAHKELLDHSRDGRALASTAMYSLMGPLVIGALATSITMDTARLSVMASVFVMVAAFTGSMTLAADTIAGERERRSLLPLILNSSSSLEILLGKFMAAWVFALASCTLTTGALMVLILLRSPVDLSQLPLVIPALVTLSGLAAALEILVSVTARNVKEATGYVSMLTFLAMGVGMWCAFRPTETDLGLWAPISGHQRALQFGFSGERYSGLDASMLSLITAVIAALVIVQAARVFRRNEVNYRN